VEHHQAAELHIRAGKEKLVEARHAVESGTALEADADEGEAGIASARLELRKLEDTEADLRGELNDLLGLPLETQLELIVPEESDEGAAPDTAQKTPAIPFAQIAAEWNNAAKIGNPELVSARSTVDKAAAGVKAAQLEFLPDLSLFAEHVYQSGVPLLPANSVIVGLRLEWTISEFGKRTSEIHERKAQAEQATENLRQTENRIRLGVEKGVRKLRETDLEIEAAQAAVKTSTERRRITADQVEAKTTNPSMLTEAEAKLREAQAQLFEARTDRATAQAELDALTDGHRSN
jgi:outer membrane protein TolC